MGKCRLPGGAGGENLTHVLDSQNAIITELEQKVQEVGAVDITDEVDENTALIAEVLAELDLRGTPPAIEVEVPGGYGEFVWKKLSAEGGDFINYMVSDNESEYPHKAVAEDGYWYEKILSDEGVGF